MVVCVHGDTSAPRRNDDRCFRLLKLFFLCLFVDQVFQILLMIFGVHAVEAYFLNPQVSAASAERVEPSRVALGLPWCRCRHDFGFYKTVDRCHASRFFFSSTRFFYFISSSAPRHDSATLQFHRFVFRVFPHFCSFFCGCRSRCSNPSTVFRCVRCGK